MRRLTLRTEALTDLTPDELTDVAGGATQTCVVLTNLATLCHLCQLLTRVTCP